MIKGKAGPPASSSSKQIASFLAKYNPATAAAARKARAAMRKRIPGGIEFVYDNYNALVFGYGPTERPSDAVLSLAIMPVLILYVIFSRQLIRGITSGAVK